MDGDPKAKRAKREDATTTSTIMMFDNLVEWIRRRDGFVHDAVGFSIERREMLVISTVPEGTVLMKIPQRTVVVSRPFLPDCFREILGSFDSKNKSEKEHMEDLVLALYLANRPEEISPYLDSLPDADSFCTLPVRWTPEEQSRLLQGSPVLQEVKKSQQVLQNDYELVSHALSRTNHVAAKRSKSPSMPSREDFSYAMALVESRAFELDGMFDDSNGAPIPAMIPLLDLCDHRRGQQQGAERKNLSYSFQDGNVVVVAVKEIWKEDALRITYGARPNSTLLLKYGFCLQDNIEPDGSSNDTLAFYPIADTTKDTIPSVELRTGPKSYTYGKFVQALECFFSRSKIVATQTENAEHGREDDLGAFLDECDETENQDGWWDEDNRGDDDDANAFADASPAESTLEEIQALSRFEARLLQVVDSYGMRPDLIAKTLATFIASPEYYAALLLHSELRIVRFFLLAIRRVRSKLQRTTDIESFVGIISLGKNDLSQIEEQVEDLANAYMQIRHP